MKLPCVIHKKYLCVSALSAIACHFIFILTLCLSSTKTSAEETKVTLIRYPASDSNPYYYKRVKYFVEILDLALSKSNHPYKLEKISLPFMNETRSKTNLAAGIYDVHWLNAQPMLEPELQPIPIPLCKGLTGWRILFILPENQQQFSVIQSVNDLRHFTGGNGNDWPEANLYQRANLPQKLSSSWRGLFFMLKLKRIDYLSRSALEIFDEEDAFPELNLKIDTSLVVHYPAAYYFYVKKSNQQLAADIKVGLQRAIEDGSFDQVFNRYFQEKIKRLNLENRHLVEISTPEDRDLVMDRKNNPAFWYSENHAGLK